MHFKLRIVILSFQTVFFCCFSQNKELDSLYTIIKTTKNDTLLGKAHGRIGWLKINTDSKIAKAHLDTSQIIFKKLKDDRLVANSYYRIAVLNRRMGDFHNAKENMLVFRDLMIHEQDSVGLANANFQMGAIYFGFSDYDNALQFYNSSLKTFEAVKDSTGQGFVLNSIAILYKNTKRFDLAKKLYYDKIIPIHKTKNDKMRLGIAYHGLGAIYDSMHKLDSALHYYHKAIKLDSIENIQWGLAVNYSDIAKIHQLKKSLDSAQIYFNKAYQIQKTNNFNSDLSLTLAAIIDLKSESGNFRESEKYIDEALAMNFESPKGNREISKALYLHNKRKKKFETALNYFETFISIKDSILNEDTEKNLNDIMIKYETEKKEREIAEQEVTIKEQELTLAKKQRQLALWGGLGGVLAILLGVSFWLNKERQKRKEQEITNLKNQQEIIRLESLVSGEEKERVRLAQDLHDGINGDLSVIKFKVDSISRKKLNKGESETIENTLGMLDNAIDQVRRISHNLAPPSLQNFNLNEAITQHLGKIQLANKVTIDFQTFGKQPSFSVEQETAIYRIVQELLNNIVKHAEATETLVQLNHTAEFTELVIEDNGKGFDTKISKNGIGLQNIASRVAFLKGDLNIESSGEGSTFTITLPKSSFA